MKTQNRGEWSELYAFFKVLADSRLNPGDGKLNIRPGHYYPLVKVIRKEGGEERTFSLVGRTVRTAGDGCESQNISVEDFGLEALSLLEVIRASTGTFPAPRAEAFLNQIGCTQIKADSGSKADIVIQVHDSRTNLQPILGFSIKSKLGGASTLLNAGKTTNFVFRIDGAAFSDADMQEVNGIDSRNKLRDRVNTIIQKNCSLDFKYCENKIFYNNLTLIDSSLPAILAGALRLSNEHGIVSFPIITQRIERDNPLAFDQRNNHEFYRVKLKRFLSDVALGMMPSRVWTGQYNGTEGYIIVKTDGELVCYHIIEKNLFEDYLLTNTKLETASTERHGFGSVYKEGKEYFFKLNLQIRFT